jgi:hypothetical protein
MPAYYDAAAAAFRGEGIPVVDQRRRLSAPAGGPSFQPNDPHLSAAGSRIAAEALRECLLGGPGSCD